MPLTRVRPHVTDEEILDLLFNNYGSCLTFLPGMNLTLFLLKFFLDIGRVHLVHILWLIAEAAHGMRNTCMAVCQILLSLMMRQFLICLSISYKHSSTPL